MPCITDIQAAALATRTRPGTIRVWLHRGRLTHHGHDPRGRDLVDLDELTTLTTTTTTNAAA
jgi:hypothetical protein